MKKMSGQGLNESIDALARRSTELELTVEAIHHSKQYLVSLDQRLNQIREGCRVLQTNLKRPHREETPTWILCPGGVFVQASTERTALLRLEKETNDVKRQIEAEREILKLHVVELARLEGPDGAIAKLNEGFSLKGGGR